MFFPISLNRSLLLSRDFTWIENVSFLLFQQKKGWFLHPKVETHNDLGLKMDTRSNLLTISQRWKKNKMKNFSLNIFFSPSHSSWKRSSLILYRWNWVDLTLSDSEAKFSKWYSWLQTYRHNRFDNTQKIFGFFLNLAWAKN